MRILVCGSRSFANRTYAKSVLMAYPATTTIVHGGARGADSLAGEVAKELGMTVEVYPADWDGLGKRAGYVRNKQMVDSKPDLVIAFWNGVSKGTKHTIDLATAAGIPVEVYS